MERGKGAGRTMVDPNWQNRTLFHGDNPGFLRAMNSDSVDLIATDPPFNKGRDFHATPDSLAAGAKFQDRWSWERDVHEEWTDQITDDHPRLMEAIERALCPLRRHGRVHVLHGRASARHAAGAQAHGQHLPPTRPPRTTSKPSWTRYSGGGTSGTRSCGLIDRVEGARGISERSMTSCCLPRRGKNIRSTQTAFESRMTQ